MAKLERTLSVEVPLSSSGHDTPPSPNEDDQRVGVSENDLYTPSPGEIEAALERALSTDKIESLKRRSPLPMLGLKIAVPPPDEEAMKDKEKIWTPSVEELEMTLESQMAAN